VIGLCVAACATTLRLPFNHGNRDRQPEHTSNLIHSQPQRDLRPGVRWWLQEAGSHSFHTMQRWLLS
jgi:hypothetical protein